MPERLHNSSQGRGCVMIIVTILVVFQILFITHVLIDNGVEAKLLHFPPLLQVGIAFIWLILFIYAIFRLWKKHTHAIRYSLWLIVGFIVTRLMQTVLFVQADYDRNRIGFQVVVTLMILTVPGLMLLSQYRQGTQK